MNLGICKNIEFPTFRNVFGIQTGKFTEGRKKKLVVGLNKTRQPDTFYRRVQDNTGMNMPGNLKFGKVFIKIMNKSKAFNGKRFRFKIQTQFLFQCC